MIRQPQPSHRGLCRGDGAHERPRFPTSSCATAKAGMDSMVGNLKVRASVQVVADCICMALAAGRQQDAS